MNPLVRDSRKTNMPIGHFAIGHEENQVKIYASTCERFPKNKKQTQIGGQKAVNHGNRRSKTSIGKPCKKKKKKKNSCSNAFLWFLFFLPEASRASSAKPERPGSSRTENTTVPGSRPLSALGPPSSRPSERKTRREIRGETRTGQLGMKKEVVHIWPICVGFLLF